VGGSSSRAAAAGAAGGLGGAACMYNTPKYLLLEILDKGK